MLSDLHIFCPFCKALFTSTTSMEQHQVRSGCARLALTSMMSDVSSSTIPTERASGYDDEFSIMEDTLMEEAPGNIIFF